jgi:metal-responsive CopG/Arc/MetJ family transcriptional regulator
MITTEKVTVTLPTNLMVLVRTLAPGRSQSQFIAEALRTYIAEQQRKSLRERLIAGYQTNARADSALAAEWEPIADETWPTYRASTRQSR